MSTDFIRKPSRALENSVNAATDFESMRELLKADLADNQGVLTRMDDNNYMLREHVVVQAEPSAPSPDTDRCLKVIYIGNSRFEIAAPDEQTLATRETAIRNLYGGQR